jgi:hypothetical protein
MAKFNWKKLKEGDLFKIPDGKGNYLLGQILIPGVTFHMHVFDVIFLEEENFSIDTSSAKTILFGETTDAEFYHQRWTICGNSKIPEKFPQPYNVVNTADGLILRDFYGNTLRSATQDDFTKFGYEVSVSPSKFTTAVKAFIELGLAADFGSIDVRRVASRSTLE